MTILLSKLTTNKGETTRRQQQLKKIILFTIPLFLLSFRKYHEFQSLKGLSWEITKNRPSYSQQANHDILNSKNEMHMNSLVPDESFSACILWMDDNHHMAEWIAYHYFALPLRHLVIAVDPYSSTQLEIPKRWYSLMDEITVWSDSDFAQENLTRSPKDDKGKLKNMHNARQAQFYQECSRYLHHRNRTYTTYHDTDEFLTISDEFFFSREQNHQSRTTTTTATHDAEDYSSVAFKRQPGHILKLIQAYKQAPPGSHNNNSNNNNSSSSSSSNVSQTIQRDLSEICLHVPRALYSAVESERNVVQQRYYVPDWIDPDRFDTLRYRYRHTKRGKHDGLGKAVIDVSRITDEDLRQGGRTHRPLLSVCPASSPWRNYGSIPLGIHHYLGSWESYSFRDDARKGTLRRRDIWLERAVERGGGSDDEIRPWIQGFVDSMGMDVARELLQNAGLPNATSVGSNETEEKPGW